MQYHMLYLEMLLHGFVGLLQLPFVETGSVATKERICTCTPLMYLVYLLNRVVDTPTHTYMCIYVYLHKHMCMCVPTKVETQSEKERKGEKARETEREIERERKRERERERESYI